VLREGVFEMAIIDSFQSTENSISELNYKIRSHFGVEDNVDGFKLVSEGGVRYLTSRDNVRGYVFIESFNDTEQFEVEKRRLESEGLRIVDKYVSLRRARASLYWEKKDG
jgi:hypothetical protein